MKVLRVAAWTAGGLVLAVPALLVVILLAVQSDTVGRAVFNRVVARVAPAGAELSVSHVSGSWVGGLVLEELVWTQRTDTIRADTVRLDWSLLEWRLGRITVAEATVAGVRARLDAGGGSTRAADTMASTSSNPPAAQNSTEGGWTVRLEELAVRRANVELAEAPPGGEEAYRLSGVEVGGTGVQVSPGFGLDSIRIEGRFAPPDRPVDWGRAEIVARFRGDTLSLDTLALESPGSSVRGRGQIGFAELLQPGGVTWEVHASPLVLGDIAGLGFVPSALADDTLELSTTARPEGAGARVELLANTSGGDTISAGMRWGREDTRWSGEGFLSLEVAQADAWPGLAVLGAPVDARIDGELQGRLGDAIDAGRAIELLEGRGRIDLTSTTALMRADLTLDPREEVRGDSLVLAVERLVWDRLALDRALLTLTRSDSSGAEPRPLAWALDAAPTSGGRIVGEGMIGNVASLDPLGYEGDVTLRGVVDPYSGSQISGRLQLEGRGTDPAEAQARADLVLTASKLGSVSLDTADFEVRWDAGDAEVRGSAATALGGGLVALTASTEPAGGRFDLERLGLDSLVIPGSARAADHLRASGEGDGSWTGGPFGFTDPEAITARLELASPEARVRGVALDSARVSARWQEGRVEATLLASLPDSGHAVLRGQGRALDPVELTLEEGRFRGVNLAEVVDGGPMTELNGSMTARYHGQPIQVEAGVRFEPSLILGDTLQSLEARLEGRTDTVSATFEARLAGGTVDGRFGAPGLESLGGTASSDAPPWTMSLDGDLTRAGGFVGQPDSAVSLRFSAAAQSDSAGATVQARVVDGRGWGVRLDTAVFAGRVRGSLLVVDTVGLRTNWTRGGGRGELPLGLMGGSAGDSLARPPSGDPRFALRLEVSDSTDAQEFGNSDLLARSGSLHVATRCDARRCRAEGGVALESVLYRDYSAAAVDLGLDVGLGPGLSVAQGGGSLKLAGVRTPSAAIRAVEAALEVVDGVWNLEASALLDERRDATLAVDVDPGPERIRIRDFAFRMDDDQWRLQAPGSVRYGGTGIRLDTLEVVAGDQRLVAGGVWEGANGTDVVVQLDSVRVGTVSDLAGAPDLDGWVDARMKVKGPPGVPRVEGTASGELTHDGEPLHSFAIAADQREGIADLDLSLRDPSDQERLRFSGDIPLDGDDLEWDLDLVADSLPLGWLQPYIPDELARDLYGALDAEVRVEGARPDPLASGQLALDSARVGLPVAGITLTQARLRASIDERTLTVDTLFARSVGTARVGGEIRLPSPSEPTELDLSVEADGFIAMNTSAIRTVVDGSAALTGTARQPELTGTVRIPEAVIRLDEAVVASGVEDVTLSDRDWQMLQTRFGLMPPDDRTRSLPLYEAISLDLSVELGRDLWVRQQSNPEMQVQFTGGFTVQKDTESELLDLQGDLEAIPQRSYIEQFGRRFELEEGSAQLRGPVEETRIDVTSVYRVPPRGGTTSEVAVRLDLDGRPGDLSLALSSTPSMENADIVSYLATGRPASQAFGGDGGAGTSAAEVGTGIVASQLTSAVEEFALRSVGLDVLEIRRDGLRQATLVAGQYVTPELFLGFRQPLSFGDDEASGPAPEDVQAQLEWQTYRWLLLHLETGGSAFRFFLQGSYGY